MSPSCQVVLRVLVELFLSPSRLRIVSRNSLSSLPLLKLVRPPNWSWYSGRVKFQELRGRTLVQPRRLVERELGRLQLRASLALSCYSRMHWLVSLPRAFQRLELRDLIERLWGRPQWSTKVLNAPLLWNVRRCLLFGYEIPPHYEREDKPKNA